ncbi:MAG: YvcK family protein [Patescibacteria group bacterium]|nr:YvcK family protein [Patescibacteria group bacterium]
MKTNKKIVCLGGGIGTVNLIKGLKEYTDNITVVVSMADDGGSAGRLRRFFGVPPPGDLVSCIAAMSEADKEMKSLLTYRFNGNRYGSDHTLAGHKLGNLILVALTSITGSFNKAVSEMQRIFNAQGKILPSTDENISIWAKTSVGEKVYREENIDLGKFTGRIDRLYLKPSSPTAPKEVISALLDADAIIAGPGDLYTTIMPTLLVPSILSAIKTSNVKKIFVVNVTNKVFETPEFRIDDYVNAIIKHCKSRVFEYFLVNNNFKSKIPAKYKYQYDYVPINGVTENLRDKIIKEDLIDENFPLYHDSEKLAKAIVKSI